jgi:spore photoproduct lyase
MINLERFTQFIIHPDSVDSEVAKNIYKLVPSKKILVSDRVNVETPKGMLAPEDFAQSKRLVFVKKHSGQFFKRCPGAGPGLTCCNYFVLNLGLQCDMNCSYCYLQSFINTPTMEIYSNIDDALIELSQLWSKDQPLRLGTGEVIDSLSMDPLTLYSRKLITYFKDKPKWLLEFKSKTNFVDQFIDEEHAGNVVVSWSINPQEVVAAEEHGTASLSQRLLAARKCKDRGFKISFHIDPMIYFEGWQAAYKDLVKQISEQFDPSDIPYISVGALRFQKEQKAMMRKRFGFKSHVVNSEMFVGSDGKLRYDQNLRQEMFNFVLNEFKQSGKSWNVFLCMENHETWLSTFGTSPKSVDGLTSLFEGRRSFASL